MDSIYYIVYFYISQLSLNRIASLSIVQGEELQIFIIYLLLLLWMVTDKEWIRVYNIAS